MTHRSRMRSLLEGVARVGTAITLLTGLGITIDWLGLTRPIIPRPWSFLGIGTLACGLILEAAATHALWTIGGGTPNPIDPPRALVSRGPYRLTRNPLYFARILLLAGVGMVISSSGVLLVTLALFVFVHFVLLPREESRLLSRFGDAYLEYARRVPRWLTVRSIITIGRRGDDEPRRNVVATQTRECVSTENEDR